MMHPPGPMLDSEFGRIQIFFAVLTLLLLFAAGQVARGFHHLEGQRVKGEVDIN